MDKKILAVQQALFEDSAKISAIVNFFNSTQGQQ